MESNTKNIKAATVFFMYLLGPITAITYLLYCMTFFLINKKVPKVIIFFPIGLIFGIMNILHNLIVCSILFREFPRELFTTNRLKRWKKQNNDTPRRELADMMGGFLNSQDEDHY